MAKVHRLDTVLAEDGKLSLDQLPFRAGQAVEVILVPTPLVPTQPGNHPLAGTVLRYDMPTDSVAENDWEALP